MFKVIEVSKGKEVTISEERNPLLAGIKLKGILIDLRYYSRINK